MAILPFENHARNYQIRSIDYILLRYVFIYECDSCRSLQSVCYTVYTITFWVILINNPLLRSDVLVVNEKGRGRRGPTTAVLAVGSNLTVGTAQRPYKIDEIYL